MSTDTNDSPSTCSYCGAICHGLHEEVAHMQAAHPDVIEERLSTGGFRKEGDKWVDVLSDPES